MSGQRLPAGLPAEDELLELCLEVVSLTLPALPQDRAQLLRAEGEHPRSALPVFQSLARACRSHPAATALAASIFLTSQAPILAYRFLDTTLGSTDVSESDVEELAAFLNAGGRPELSVYAFTAASRHQPIATALRYSEILTKRGHPESASDMLTAIAAARPAEVGALVAALRHARRGPEVDPLLLGLARTPPATCALLLRTLAEAGLTAEVQVVIDTLRAQSAPQLAAIFAAVDSGSASDSGLAVDTGSAAVISLLASAIVTRPVAEILACFDPSAAGLTVPQRRNLTATLFATAPDKCPEQLTTWYGGWADPTAVAGLVSRVEDYRIDPEPILEAIVRRRDFQDVCATLHQQGSHRLAYLLVSIRAEYGR